MPKVFYFAPVGQSHTVLEAAGCDVELGKAEWHEPDRNYEPEMIRMAQGAAALAGTSMRSSPISRGVLQASPDLRVVAKATVGVDDIDVDACTEMGILVTHAPVAPRAEADPKRLFARTWLSNRSTINAGYAGP